MRAVASVPVVAAAAAAVGCSRGGLYIDFAKAGGRERCAVLEFFVPGRPEPLRRRVFVDQVTACS